MITRIDKPWGWEEWLDVNDKYAFKKLFMLSGHKCSLQYHVVKRESFYVISGKLKFRIGHDVNKLVEKIMLPGDTYIIDPGIVHQMEAMEDSVYIEASTPEVEDVVRLKDEYGRI